MSSQFAFTSRFLATDLNNNNFPASVFTSLLSGEYPATELNSVKVKVKVKVTLRVAVYGQSFRVSIKILETHDQRFF
jgi:hypothetical protein